MENKIMTPAMKGLIIGLVMIAVSVVMQLLITDLEKMQKLNWVTFLIIIASIVWACFSHSKDMNGNVTFGNLFAHGFKTAAVFTIIMIIYTLLAMTILFPEMKEKMLEVAMKQAEAKGTMSEAQLEQARTMTEKFLVPFAIGGSLVMYLVIGAIGSLLGAAIAKKNPDAKPFQ
jgi:amino acid transporter